MITSLYIIYNAGGGYKNRSARKFLEKYLKNILKLVDFYLEIWYNVLVKLRGKPRSHSDLPTEEREKVSPSIHNNPPEILRPLNLISPSLKINHSTLQERLHSFFVWLVHIYYSLENSRSKDRLFFLLYKRTDAQPKKIGRPGPKKGGGGGKKKRPPAEEKNSPPRKQKYRCAEEKIGCDKKKLHSI